MITNIIEKRSSGIKTAIHICIVLIVIPYGSAFSGFDKQQQGSRMIAMGNAGTAISGNPWSMFYNPAMSAGLERSGGAYFAPAPYDLPDLATGAVVYCEPFSFGNICAGFQIAGFKLYRETGVNISYANVFDGMIKYGVTANYYSLSIQNYGSTGVFGIDAGIGLDIIDQLTIGAFASNINQPKIGSDIKERLPMVFSFGAAYRPVTDALVTADLQKDINFPMNIRAGVEYSPIDVIALRIGAGSAPALFSAGIGMKYKGIHVDYSFRNHPDLDGIHSFSIGFIFTGNSDE